MSFQTVLTEVLKINGMTIPVFLQISELIESSPKISYVGVTAPPTRKSQRSLSTNLKSRAIMMFY